MQARTMKIAAIEGDVVDQLILRRLFAGIPEWHVELRVFADGRSALADLPDDPPELIFLDYVLGDFTATQLLGELRTAGVDRPAILLTSDDDKHIALQAMQAGAADYIPKQALSVNSLRRATATALAQRELEDKLRAQREHLEQTNQELTRRNQEIRGFHHLLSHELRGPAGAALTAADLLLQEALGPLNPEQREFVAIIESSCKQLMVQIQDLLDIARLETGKLTLRPQRSDLAKLVRRAVAALAPVAGNHGIAVTCEVAAELPELSVDQERIGQVLTNLLNNAMKFTPPAGSIHVTVDRERADGDWLRVAVQDTGRGIPRDHLPHLFEQLYQVSPDDSRTKGGLGLGLSLCRDLVGLHGGRIGVDSQPGQGSTFWFLLPLAPATADSVS